MSERVPELELPTVETQLDITKSWNSVPRFTLGEVQFTHSRAKGEFKYFTRSLYSPRFTQLSATTWVQQPVREFQSTPLSGRRYRLCFRRTALLDRHVVLSLSDEFQKTTRNSKNSRNKNSPFFPPRSSKKNKKFRLEWSIAEGKKDGWK